MNTNFDFEPHPCDAMDLNMESSFLPHFCGCEGQQCGFQYFSKGEIYNINSRTKVETSVDKYNLFPGDRMIVVYGDEDNPDESGCQIMIFRRSNSQGACI